MPNYLYKCEECQKEFEIFHSINVQLDECPTCKLQGKIPIPPTKLIAPGGTFILSGQGWARDNYSK